MNALMHETDVGLVLMLRIRGGTRCKKTKEGWKSVNGKF